MLNREDKDVLKMMKRDPEAAMSIIFDSYHDLVFSRVYRVLYDKQATEDVVQEIFLSLWQKRADLHITTSLKAYLSRMALNRALNYVRDNKKYKYSDETVLITVASDRPGILAGMQRDELERVIHAAIENLPERCRLVFSLSRFEDMSYREIAEELEISVKTVENQILKALKILREAVEKFKSGGT